MFEYLSSEILDIRSDLMRLSNSASHAFRYNSITLDSVRGRLETLIYFLYATPHKEAVEKYANLLWYAFESPMPWYWDIIKLFSMDMYVRARVKRIIGPANTILSLAEQYARTLQKRTQPKVSMVEEVEEMGVDFETFERIHNHVAENLLLERRIFEIKDTLKIYTNQILQLGFSPEAKELAVSLSTVLYRVPSNLSPNSDAYRLVEGLVKELYSRVGQEYKMLKESRQR